jgi:tRNA (Thr-GGU) A37 N-methylase
MTVASDIRPGEIAVSAPDVFDAGVYFIRRLRTPWSIRSECAKKGDPDNGPVCWAEIDPLWAAAMTGLGGKTKVQVLYWMHEARRDLVLQSPRHDGTTVGTFALRSSV